MSAQQIDPSVPLLSWVEAKEQGLAPEAVLRRKVRLPENAWSTLLAPGAIRGFIMNSTTNCAEPLFCFNAAVEERQALLERAPETPGLLPVVDSGERTSRDLVSMSEIAEKVGLTVRSTVLRLQAVGAPVPQACASDGRTLLFGWPEVSRFLNARVAYKAIPPRVIATSEPFRTGPYRWRDDRRWRG